MVIKPDVCREIVGAVIYRTEALGGKIGQGARIPQAPIRAIQRKDLALGRAIPAFGKEVYFGRAFALLRQYVDDTTDRLRAVKRSSRAAQHFDAIEIVGGKVGDIE